MKIIKDIIIVDPKYVDHPRYGTRILTWESDEMNILHNALFSASKDELYVRVYVNRGAYKEDVATLKLDYFLNVKPTRCTSKKERTFYSRVLSDEDRMMYHRNA